MKNKLLLLAISSAILCLSAVPARAGLFNFNVNTLDMTYIGNTFTADVSGTSGGINFARSNPPASTSLAPGPPGLGDFHISMTISGITGTGTPGDPYSATGAGSWTLTDYVGDTITGNVAGTWTLPVPALGPRFDGLVSNVWWNNESADNDFDGTSTAVSMFFATSSPPWYGGLQELTTAPGANWFGLGPWSGTVTGGSVQATVVPVPGAVLLGMLGLSVAGLKLRKSA